MLVQELFPLVQIDVVEQKPDVSFVMPTFNEESNITDSVRTLIKVARDLGVTFELVVVNDGSLDGTLTRVLDYASGHNNVKIVTYGKNMGKGFAVKTGFFHAKGDIVVFIDSDLDINPYQVDKYLTALESADMVIASKWHPQSKVEITSIRRFFSKSFNAMVRLLTGAKIMDTQTGLKAVKRGALQRTFSKLTVKQYAYDVELLAIATREGIKTVELPVDLKLSALFNLKDAWRMSIDLLGIAYRLKIRKCY
jgi:dolichol-phosphate mannosyltransferase